MNGYTSRQSAQQPPVHPPVGFAPLEFIQNEDSTDHRTVNGGTTSGFGQAARPRAPFANTSSYHSSAIPRAPIGIIPTPFAPSPGPSIWKSPFEAAVAALATSDSRSVTGAITAVAEAETQVRRGITAANNWWPSIVEHLRGYFAVSHSSVGYKLIALFIPLLGASYRLLWRSTPFIHQETNHPSSLHGNDHDEIERSQHNIHHSGPDLYLPVMSFLSYVLLYGFSKATFDDFHPELLSSTASFAAVITIIEVILAISAFYVVGVQLPFLDILSGTGQKFESLMAILIAGMIISQPTPLYWGCLLYFGFCSAHATFQSLKDCEQRNRPTSEWGSQRSRPLGFLYISVVVALCQIPLCWLLTPSFTSKLDGTLIKSSTVSTINLTGRVPFISKFYSK